jgi:hypothetical protein
LKTKKFKYFNDFCQTAQERGWSFMVDIYYLGYQLLPEGKILITDIKNSWNNFRLSIHYLKNKKNLAINSIFEDKFKTLFSLSSSYEIKTVLDL